jgi:hypothetical protein
VPSKVLDFFRRHAPNPRRKRAKARPRTRLSPLIGAELEFVPEEQPSLHDDVIVGRARERLRFISVPERFLYEASRNNPSCMLECPALPEARLRFCEGETRMAELLDHARETAILIDGAVLATNRK